MEQGAGKANSQSLIAKSGVFKNHSLSGAMWISELVNWYI